VISRSSPGNEPIASTTSGRLRASDHEKENG
jgi:hypothetical protein